MKLNAVTFADVRRAHERAAVALMYRDLRQAHPEVPARLVLGFLRDGYDARNLSEYACGMTTGHQWAYSGSAYGGDDDSYHGEGRCYCANCGADGDA